MSGRAPLVGNGEPTTRAKRVSLRVATQKRPDGDRIGLGHVGLTQTRCADFDDALQCLRGRGVRQHGRQANDLKGDADSTGAGLHAVIIPPTDAY